VRFATIETADLKLAKEVIIQAVANLGLPCTHKSNKTNLMCPASSVTLRP
jgi:hypothetical protein